MHKIRIGSRGSAMAMHQAEMVRKQLLEAHEQIEVEIVEIRTSGDWSPEHGEKRLSEAQGGKGLFAKEIELRILDGSIDCGVHCVKDMPSFLPEGLEISHYLTREDPRDALLTRDPSIHSVDALPQNATIGTASVRRAAILLAKRPDLNITPLRGNVHTRISKLRNGLVDATILSYCGLERLELTDEAAHIFSTEEMIPACGQGGLCIEIRENDEKTRQVLAPLDDTNARLCMSAERAMLKILDGSCHTPIGAYATIENQAMTLRGLVISEDGQNSYTETQIQNVTNTEEAERLGDTIGQQLKSIVPNHILAKDAA